MARSGDRPWIGRAQAAALELRRARPGRADRNRRPDAARGDLAAAV